MPGEGQGHGTQRIAGEGQTGETLGFAEYLAAGRERSGQSEPVAGKGHCVPVSPPAIN